MLRHFLFIVILGLSFLTGVAAQENENPRTFWNEKFIRVIYTPSGEQLQVGDVRSDFVWGLKPEMRKVMGEFPDSKTSVEEFDKGHGAGLVMMFGGLVVELGGLIFVNIQANSPNAQLTPTLVGAGIGIGGGVVSIVGSLILANSYQKLFEGVDQYNADEFEKYSGTLKAK